MSSANRAFQLRRKAIVAAAFCAILGGIVPLGLHAHRWLGFLCIGAQIALLVIALSLFAKSRRPAAGGPQMTPPRAGR